MQSNPWSVWQQLCTLPWQAQSAFWQTASTIMQQRTRAVQTWQQEAPTYLHQLSQCQTFPQWQEGMGKWAARTTAQALNLAADNHAARTHLLRTWQQLATACLPIPQTSSPAAPSSPSNTSFNQTLATIAAKASAQPRRTPATTTPAAQLPLPQPTAKPKANTTPIAISSTQKAETTPAPQPETNAENRLRQTGGHGGAVAARASAASSARHSVVARRAGGARRAR